MGSNAKKKDGFRVGQVKNVYQKFNTSLKTYQKYETKSGELKSTKITGGPYKGVKIVK